MTEIIYTLIYFIPLAILAASKVFPALAEVDTIVNPGFPFIFIVAVSTFVGILISVQRKLKLIIIGSLSALLLGAVLVSDKQRLKELLSQNQWIFAALILVAAVVFAGYLSIRARAIKLIIGIAVLGILLSSYWTGIFDKKIEVVSVLFLAVTILTEETRNRVRKDNLSRKFLVHIVPFLFVAALGLFYIPTSDKPYDWALVKGIANAIEEKVTVFFQGFEEDNFELLEAATGFSESGKISGNLSNSSKEMMTITTGMNTPENIYLDGKYFDSFNGRDWTQSNYDYPYMFDTIETQCALYLVEKSRSGDFCKFMDLKVSYLSQNTRRVFSPLKAESFSSPDGKVKILIENQTPMFKKKRGKSTEYKVRAAYLNYNSEMLERLIEAGRGINEAKWDIVRHNLGLDDDIYSYEKYLEYKRNLKDSIKLSGVGEDTKNESTMDTDSFYNSLSSDVKDFLTKSTSGAKNDYEKLLGIEAALKSFTYTVSPGSLPEEIDTPAELLDYFLLQSKEGYCNSFATAFVLLCKAEGIPARYVQGYYVKNTKDKTKTVLSSMAHAYPEAYVDGIGWMIFEPSAGYSCREMWDEAGMISVPPNYNPMEDRKVEEEIVDEVPEIEEEEEPIKWYMIAVPVAMCLLVLFVIVLLERVINRYRFNRLSEEEKTHVICLKIVNMLKGSGISKADYETIREYAKRVEEKTAVTLGSLVEAFEKYVYSSSEISKETQDEVYKEYSEVLAYLRKNNRLLYIYFRLWN